MALKFCEMQALTDVNVTVQILKGCIVLLPDNGTVHELRVQLEQARR